MKTKLLILSIIIIAGINISAQPIDSREKTVLNKGIEYYKNGNYKEAANSFNLVINRLPNSRYITSYYLMLAKSNYKLGKYSDAINQAKDFLVKYPTSEYVDDIFMLQGDSFYRLKRFESAISHWFEGIEYSPENRLKKILRDRIVNTLALYFSESEIKTLDINAPSTDVNLAKDMALYIKYLNKNPAKAERILQNSMSLNSSSEFYNDAKELLTQETATSTNSFKIALLLPFSGYNDKIAKEIKEGVEFAVNGFNSSSAIQLELLLNDYGDNLSNALIELKNIARDKSILGVYGPLENDFSAACAAVCEYEQLPIFSPTASENKLTKLSRYFYQLNNSTGTQAESMARFAIDSLDIKRFATFAPIENQFVDLVNRFIEICENYDAEVVAQEWYYPGEQDFYQKFMKLKRKGLKLSFSDSLMLDNPDYSELEIDSLYQLYIEEEVEKAEENFTKVDSADIPVTSIQGMFVPIYQEDLQFIAPQIAYSNIQAQVFGNSDWYNFDELKKNKNYIDGIIFGSDGFLNEESWEYKKFRNDFRTANQKTPTKYNLIGYDTFNYILQYLKNTKNPISRNEFIKMLNKKLTYNGVYRKFNLDENNSNQNVQIIKYKFGQFLPLN